MKKLLVLSLIAMMLLVGCKEEKKEENKKESKAEVLYETILHEEILHEEILTEEKKEEEPWVSDEYKAELEFNSQENDWE